VDAEIPPRFIPANLGWGRAASHRLHASSHPITLAIPARSRFTLTALTVLPILSAITASGAVPSKASSSAVHLGPW